MTASLQTTAGLAGDPLFQSRVQAAMITSALTVAAEAVGAQTMGNYNLRHALARNILQNQMANGVTLSGQTAWLTQFTWAVAANATVAGDAGTPVSITASSAAIPAVITTATVHGLTTGQWTEIAGHQGNPAVAGTWQVTVTDTLHFTVPTGSGTAGTGGTMIAAPSDTDIQTAVTAVFGAVAGVGAS